MIGIVDYGSGNLRSVTKACERLGSKAAVTADPQRLRQADKIILPGVGAFEDAIQALTACGLVDVLKELILEAKKPYLGICLGMQLLFERSEESEGAEGFGICRGTVKKFDSRTVKVPHMGWNVLRMRGASPLFQGIDDGFFFYFCHSYYCAPEDDTIISTVTDYGTEFASSIGKDNIFAVQFHPEKSQKLGLRVLENFLTL
ncbi:MAG: imidazole glycerol phosphate synthase subunit HisH [Candidatus Omnitrophica bacterium]|nr:imidazole glycerol phosphate synthase subunit HisH [Candidatus Omnitrophota bacterium]